eukprot:TRINITY_DN32679_c0_g1_i1.p1 TRINITY_DN32679_c0_g1~~TRINITY_DN32679_c0_g1_i1.p1  ORF type:complete len:397 (+),score=125.38 TRINITY_DN32679_c0_g1_i1:39-1229(+)
MAGAEDIDGDIFAAAAASAAADEDEAPAAPPVQHDMATCPYCGKQIKARSLEAHKPHCLRKRYGGRVGICLRDEKAMTTLSKLAKRHMTCVEVFDNGTDGIMDDIPVADLAQEASGVTEEMCKAMEARAYASGMRTERVIKKHVPQEVALCQVMAKMIKERAPEVHEAAMRTGDARASVCIIDAGAAAGELLHLFQEIFKTTVVLVEFYEPVRSVDDHYKDDPENFKRLWKRCEDVTKEDLAPYRRDINIIVAKHLCGDSMDEAMMCIVDGWRTFFPVDLFVAAPCCQQMSTWPKYLGAPYLHNTYGLNEEDFEPIRFKTAWKSLDHRDSIKQGQSMGSSRYRHLWDIATIYETAWHMGRVDYLRRIGAECSIFQFVPTEVTVKNVCITASFPRTH